MDTSFFHNSCVGFFMTICFRWLFTIAKTISLIIEQTISLLLSSVWKPDIQIWEITQFCVATCLTSSSDKQISKADALLWLVMHYSKSVLTRTEYTPTYCDSWRINSINSGIYTTQRGRIIGLNGSFNPILSIELQCEMHLLLTDETLVCMIFNVPICIKCVY